MKNSLRRAYYDSVGLRSAESHHSTPLTRLPHVRHCFDLLRQEIMCAADTNLEAVSKSTGGVHGFGVQKMCRDYEAVREWAERWGAPADLNDLSM